MLSCLSSLQSVLFPCLRYSTPGTLPSPLPPPPYNLQLQFVCTQQYCKARSLFQQTVFFQSPVRSFFNDASRVWAWHNKGWLGKEGGGGGEPLLWLLLLLFLPLLLVAFFKFCAFVCALHNSHSTQENVYLWPLLLLKFSLLLLFFASSFYILFVFFFQVRILLFECDF